MDIFSTLIKFYRLLYRTEIIHDFLEEHTQHHWLPERNNVHFTNRNPPPRYNRSFLYSYNKILSFIMTNMTDGLHGDFVLQFALKFEMK